MTHVHLCPLRWGDMDAQGHVNNGAFVDYLQEARVDFLTRSPLAGMLGGARGGDGHGGDERSGGAGHGVLVVSHQLELLGPLVWSTEPLPVHLDVAAVGGASFTLGYRVGDPDAPRARARTLLTPYDLRAGRVLRLTRQQRALLGGLVVPQEPLRGLPDLPEVGGAATHAVPLRVRWSDLDAYGHVNNVRFYDYVQEGRIRLLEQLGGSPAGRSWLVVRQDVDYRVQLGYRTEPYEVATTVARLGRTSLTLVARVRDPASATVFAEARTVLVCADGGGRPTLLPEELRGALGEVDPGTAPRGDPGAGPHQRR